MVGDKLPGNQKDQQRLQRDITKKNSPTDKNKFS